MQCRSRSGPGNGTGSRQCRRRGTCARRNVLSFLPGKHRLQDDGRAWLGDISPPDGPLMSSARNRRPSPISTRAQKVPAVAGTEKQAQCRPRRLPSRAHSLPRSDRPNLHCSLAIVTGPSPPGLLRRDRSAAWFSDMAFVNLTRAGHKTRGEESHVFGGSEVRADCGGWVFPAIGSRLKLEVDGRVSGRDGRMRRGRDRLGWGSWVRVHDETKEI